MWPVFLFLYMKMGDCMGNKGEKKRNDKGAKIVQKQKELQLETVQFSLSKILSSNPYILILAAITLLGAYLRIHNLGTQSIWLDEGASYSYIQDTIMGTWRTSANAEQAPLHMVIMHVMTFFSSSEFSLRLPSAIFGILSIPLIYAMGERLFGKEEGIISAFLLSISIMHLWYSQEARMYAQTLLFSLASLYFFYCATKTNSKKNWVYFVISSSLAFYSHYYTVFVIIPEAVYYIWTKIAVPSIKIGKMSVENWQNFRMFIVGMGAFFVSILPLFIPFVEQSISRTSSAPTWGLGQSLSFIPTMLIQFSTREPKTSYLFMLLFVIGLIAIAMRQKDQFAFLGVYLAIPFTASYILAAKMPFSPRYLLFLLPAYLILVARGITAIANTLYSSNSSSPSKDTIKKRHTSIVIIILIFLLISFPLITEYYSVSQKNDWRVATAYIESVTQSGDVVSTLPGYMFQALVYYYDNSSDGTYRVNPPYSESGLSSFVEQHGRVWFMVTWDISAANPDGSAVRWLQNNATFVNQVTGIYIFTAPKVETST